MKKTQFVTLSIVIFVFCSCVGYKSKQVEAELNDSLKKSLLADTLIFENDGVEAIPDNVDDLYADFVYCFFTNESLQKERTEFPLAYIENGDEILVSETDWKYVSFLENLDCYAIIHEHEKDLELVKEQTIHDVSVKIVSQNTSEVIAYNFQRVNEKWMLVNVCNTALQSDMNGDFIKFFHHFASDSLFQESHVCTPLQVVIVDPVDEFNIIEASINPEQWSSFAPILTNNSLVFLDLGFTYSKHPTRKFVSLRGFGHGLDNTFKFIRKDNSWMLSKFEDYSN